MSQPQLAYIDTSVFLSYVAGQDAEPDQYPLAKAFFKEIASKKWKGAISYLTTMEILDVLRKWKGSEFEDISKMSSDAERVEYVLSGAMQLYTRIIGETLATPEFQLIDTPKIDAGMLFRTAFEILTDMKGVVRLYNSCKKCGFIQPNSFISGHKSVGVADILHALLAKESKCHTLVTFDKGFIDLAHDPRIKPLWIQILRPPRKP